MTNDPTNNNLPQELPSISTSMLNRIQEMQPEAWSRLVSVFSPIVYRWCRQSGLSSADSSDVVQEVFIAVARNISNFERRKEVASFRSWLATITRNRIRDKFRFNGRVISGAGGTEAMRAIQKAPDRVEMTTNKSESTGFEENSEVSDAILDPIINLKELDHRISRQVLKIVKANCDERTWQAFWLTTVEENSAADVSEKLQMSVASVYQAKSRVLRRIRKRIEELP